MRSFEEINADISHALRMHNVVGLRSLATEMQKLGTPQAAAVAFNALGSAAMNTGDYLQALDYYDRVLAMHEELGDLARIAGVTNNKGLVYELTGDNPQALEHYDRALALYEEQGDRVGVARVTGNLGNAYQYTGDYPQALEHFRRSLAMHEELGDRAGVATAVGNMGNVYARTGDHPQALEHYRRALAIHEEMENRAGVANVTGNMGIVYESTSDYPSALECFRRALTVHEELGDRASVARVTGNMGVVYLSTGDYPQALDHYRRALAAHEELGEPANAARVTSGIGTVYKSTGDNPQALEYYRRALAMHEHVGDRTGTALATGNMIGTLLTLDRYDEAAELLDHQATLLLDAPDIRAQHQIHHATLAEHHNDLEAAQRHFVEALAITEKAGLRSLSAEVHKGLRDLAQKRNDFAGYIEYNNEYQRITEEIRGKEATQRMAMMEAERNAEAVERERQKERALLYGALPESVATRLLRGETVEDQYENAAVLFADIAGFTTHTSSMHPSDTVKLLEDIYRRFDAICAEHGAIKVKTIGDSYLCFTYEGNGESGMGNGAVKRIAAVALAMQQAEVFWPSATANSNGNRIQLRIGIHCGPVTAGVIGKERLQYDIWGDTVNVASRMESTGEPGRIQVSSPFAEQLRLLLAVAEKDGTANSNSYNQQQLTERGEVNVKGKGTMTTYWLEGA